MNTMSALQRIDGAATPSGRNRCAVTGFRAATADSVSNAELVDGELAMRAARRIKTAEEVASLRESVAVASPR